MELVETMNIEPGEYIPLPTAAPAPSPTPATSPGPTDSEASSA
jgi:hypothetical protein